MSMEEEKCCENCEEKADADARDASHFRCNNSSCLCHHSLKVKVKDTYYILHDGFGLPKKTDQKNI